MWWEYILVFITGAAVPVFINWRKRIDDKKNFELERKDKYKLVAIEKRLEVHQQAYARWLEMKRAASIMDNVQRLEIINTARAFWTNNNLYLEPKTRKGFAKVIGYVIANYTRFEILKDPKNLSNTWEIEKEIEENLKFIEQFGDIIQQDVQLEPLRLEDKSELEKL